MKTIAYIAAEYPKQSETFVYREVRGLRTGVGSLYGDFEFTATIAGGDEGSRTASLPCLPSSFVALAAFRNG